MICHFFALGIGKKVVFVNHRPRELEIPFGPQAPLFPASAVFPVSAVIPERAAPFHKMASVERNLLPTRAHKQAAPANF